MRTDINGVLWSVQVELAMAFIIPVFAIFLTRSTVAADAAVLFALCIVCNLPGIPVPLQYAYCFYLGMMLHKVLAVQSWQNIAASRPLTWSALLLLLPIELMWHLGLCPTQLKFALNSIIAAQIIAYLVSQRHSARFMEWPSLVSLGDISYSFYVIGQPILMLLAFAFLSGTAGAFSNGEALGITIALIAISVPVTLAISGFTYRFVEKPFIRAASLRFGRGRVAEQVAAP